MKKNVIFRQLVKMTAAGLLAFLFVSLACELLYYKMPIRVPNPNGETDNLMEPNLPYVNAREGFSRGVIDTYGYANLPGSSIDFASVLLMGSSHLEGLNVMPEERISAQLNGLWGSNISYSLGTAAHYLPRNIANMENALRAAPNCAVMVLETVTTHFDIADMMAAVTDTLEPLPAYTSGISYWVQKSGYIKLLAAQWKEATLSEAPAAIGDTNPTGNESSEANTEEYNYREALKRMMAKAKAAADAFHVELAVLFHPYLTIAPQGTAYIAKSNNADPLFLEVCEEYNIHFIDMSDTFLYEYETAYVFPHGFANGPVGSGHMNADGHRMVAAAIYDFLKREALLA